MLGYSKGNANLEKHHSSFFQSKVFNRLISNQQIKNKNDDKQEMKSNVLNIILHHSQDFFNICPDEYDFISNKTHISDVLFSVLLIYR